jgi:plastocyanin
VLTASARRIARTSAILVVCTTMASAAFAAPAAPKTHTVTIEGTQFVPETLTVHRGDRVVWVNKDPFPHTVTGRKGGFDSRSIAPNASWRYVAGKAGTFPYVCTLHPTMTGTLVVE